MHYGFVIENNRKNAVHFKLSVSESDAQRDSKERMLGVQHKEPIRTFKYFENFAENKAENEAFLSHLRFVVFEGDLSALNSFFEPPAGDPLTCPRVKRVLTMPPISIENEKKMLITLQAKAEQRLKEYSQSYEKDVDMMKSAKQLTFNHRNAIVFRMGEKKVIPAYP